MKYIIATLGCKVNQYEAQAMETLLRAAGHSPADSGAADAVIVNTCAVTAESTRKARQLIRRLRGENPRAVLAVCGCFSQLEPEAVRALGADLVGGSDGRAAFIRTLLAAANGGDAAPGEAVPAPPGADRRFELLPAGAAQGRTRAYLKIQDGCDNFCAYCVIPYARGRSRSLPLADCTTQAAGLAARGFAEIVVTGIEIASYGRDLPGAPALIDAVDAVAAAAPASRLHLGSLEPRVVTRAFCQRLAALTVCRHFHLSLQSGCDATLRRMGRRYDTAGFGKAVTLLREYFPGCGLTADLIVGFPGETEAEFAETLAFIESCRFSAMHIFPYSPRPGTRAAAMADTLPRAVKAERAARAKALAGAMEDRYLQSCVGVRLSVLFETEKDGVCVGHGDNYREVSVSGTQLRGLVGNVEITGVRDKMLVGDFV